MPTISVDDFITQHPEFRNSNPAIVSTALAAAMAECDSNAFGSFWDLAVRMKAAHLISIGMYAQQPSLSPTKSPAPGGVQTTPYSVEFDRILKRIPRRMLVL